MPDSLFQHVAREGSLPRAVILIGPPKTGSTHLQVLLSRNQEFLKTLGWQWPREFGGAKAGPKGFANLATALSGQYCSPRYRRQPALYMSMVSMCRGRSFDDFRPVIEHFEREFRRVRASLTAPNLLLSTEDLAFFDGASAVQAFARSKLREMLKPFEQVDAVITFRTPRVKFLHSMFTEEVVEARQSGLSAPAASQTFTEWLVARLGANELLETAPYSSGLNLKRMADAYASSGFGIVVMDMAAAECQEQSLEDILACRVLRLPCKHSPPAHFDWPAPVRGRTFSRDFDDLKHHASIIAPHVLRGYGCVAGEKASTSDTSKWAGDHMHGHALRSAGARTRCSDLQALERLLLPLDKSFLRTYTNSTDCLPRVSTTTHRVCELDLSSAATWTAIRQVAESHGYRPCHSDVRSAQRKAPLLPQTHRRPGRIA